MRLEVSMALFGLLFMKYSATQLVCRSFAVAAWTGAGHYL